VYSSSTPLDSSFWAKTKESIPAVEGPYAIRMTVRPVFNGNDLHGAAPDCSSEWKEER
jgi:hypothetical protein